MHGDDLAAQGFEKLKTITIWWFKAFTIIYLYNIPSTGKLSFLKGLEEKMTWHPGKAMALGGQISTAISWQGLLLRL